MKRVNVRDKGDGWMCEERVDECNVYDLEFGIY